MWGEFHLCTVLQVEKSRVVQIKTKESDGYDAVQIGTKERRLSQFNKPTLGHFQKWGDKEPVAILKEFRVTSDCLLPVGTEIGAMHFSPGQKVDIQGEL